MHFLKHRGFKLGLVSNLSSPHHRAFRAAAVCRALRRHLLLVPRRTERSPIQRPTRRSVDVSKSSRSDVLFVGDSLRNDVTEPRRKHGMRSVRVGSEKPDALAV